MNLQDVNNITMTEGTVRTIHDSNGKLLWGKLTYSTTYDGDTEQDGTPAPDSPVTIDVVTGSQTVTISDGTNTGSFTVNLGTTELCKIDTYQDYIYKSGDDWYLHREIETYTFNGTESWNEQSKFSTTNRMLFGLNADSIISGDNISNRTGISNEFEFKSVQNTFEVTGFYFNQSSNYSKWIYVKIPRSLLPSEDNTGFETWLSNNNLKIYYNATPTDTKITDNTLIGQLNSIHQFLTRYGYTGTVSGNLPLVINQTTLS